MKIAIELAIVAVLIGANAFLAASEISLVYLRRSRLRSRAEDGVSGARRALDMAESPGPFLVTIQIGITLATFFAAAVGAVSLTDDVDNWIADIPINAISNHANGVALVLVTLALALITLVFGELVPKSLSISNAESVAIRVSRTLQALSTLFRPLVRVLTGCTNVVLHLFGREGRAALPNVSHAEIIALLETAEDEGVVEADQVELVEDALGFGRILVRSVMVPRVDVRSLDEQTSLGDAVQLFFSTGFSRLPVYRETQDTPIGILHIKDTFRTTWLDPEARTRPAGEFVRPAHFVPETKEIDELLEELRSSRTHVAIVVDEYGGMAGLVTLEDLLEELVGEIADEFDPGQELMVEAEAGVYDVDGRISLHDLFDVMDIDIDELEPVFSESIGGLIGDRLGRIPEEGDVVETGPLRLEVRSMDGYRVQLARVQRIRASDAEPSSDERTNEEDS